MLDQMVQPIVAFGAPSRHGLYGCDLDVQIADFRLVRGGSVLLTLKRESNSIDNSLFRFFARFSAADDS